MWLFEPRNLINSPNILHRELWANVSIGCSTESEVCTKRWTPGFRDKYVERRKIKKYPPITHYGTNCWFLRTAGFLLALYDCSKGLMTPRHKAEKVLSSHRHLYLLVSLIPDPDGSVASTFFLKCEIGQVGDFAESSWAASQGGCTKATAPLTFAGVLKCCASASNWANSEQSCYKMSMK